jgi:hypothetical protein
MGKAYQVVFECPKGSHKVSLRRKSPKTSLSEVEAEKMLEGEGVSCGLCGWHGKVSKMRLRQIVPFQVDLPASSVKLAKQWRRHDGATALR